VISIGIMISAEGSTQKRANEMLMWRTVDCWRTTWFSSAYRGSCPRSGTGLAKSVWCSYGFSRHCLQWLASPKARLAPRSGTGEGEAFTGGDDSRLLTGQAKPDWLSNFSPSHERSERLDNAPSRMISSANGSSLGGLGGWRTFFRWTMKRSQVCQLNSAD